MKVLLIKILHRDNVILVNNLLLSINTTGIFLLKLFFNLLNMNFMQLIVFQIEFFSPTGIQESPARGILKLLCSKFCTGRTKVQKGIITDTRSGWLCKYLLQAIISSNVRKGSRLFYKYSYFLIYRETWILSLSSTWCARLC